MGLRLIFETGRDSACLSPRSDIVTASLGLVTRRDSAYMFKAGSLRMSLVMILSKVGVVMIVATSLFATSFSEPFLCDLISPIE